jgi:hypothetical protein
MFGSVESLSTAGAATDTGLGGGNGGASQAAEACTITPNFEWMAEDTAMVAEASNGPIYVMSDCVYDDVLTDALFRKVYS